MELGMRVVNEEYDYRILPEWSEQETLDFIGMRRQSQVEHNFLLKTNSLWELIASKMTESGYRRTSDECKCKWKNLVAGYKETSPQLHSGARQSRCPFFDELHPLFTEKSRKGQAEQAGLRLGKRKLLKFSDEWSEEGEGEGGNEDVHVMIDIARKKKAADKDRLRVTAERSRANSMQEILEDFFKQQQQIEMQWRESVEAREAERRRRELEWRETMERVEEERMMMVRTWREREELRRARQDARSDNRDALLTALLTKLAFSATIKPPLPPL